MFSLKYYQLKEYRERLCKVGFITKHPIMNCVLNSTNFRKDYAISKIFRNENKILNI